MATIAHIEDTVFLPLENKLRRIEFEIVAGPVSSLADLRAVASVASEQFLGGRTTEQGIPWNLMANIQRLLG